MPSWSSISPTSRSSPLAYWRFCWAWSCRWRWVRNFWFRSLHLLAILVVAAEAVCGITCPLTTWEQQLRTRAGETAYRGDFIADWVHRLLFFDFEPWVFTLGYVLFGLAVLTTFILAPPRWNKTAP
jgi:hypothetical protein